MIGLEDVLSFWFDGDLGRSRTVWFDEDAAFDAACARFSQARDAAKRYALDHWTDTPRGALALIILLDQVSRNLHRGSAEAFAADAKARDIARSAIARGFDQAVPLAARVFFYLPFEHAEDPTAQDCSVRLFEPLGGDDARYARLHRDVIARFGRFPGRNVALGRISTPAEEAYLADADRELWNRRACDAVSSGDASCRR
jgi:uncharacterized protein (DUF924 family)